MAATPQLDALTAGRVVVRPWRRRRDRHQIDGWPPYTPALPAHWLVSPAPGDQKRVSYAVDLAGERRLIGRIGLRWVASGTAALGIALHPAYLGDGLGREALQLINQIGLQLGLAALRLDVAEENTRAIRCYQRVGFVASGLSWRDGYRYLAMARSLCDTRGWGEAYAPNTHDHRLSHPDLAV